MQNTLDFILLFILSTENLKNTRNSQALSLPPLVSSSQRDEISPSLLKFYQFLLNPAKSGYESACCGVILGMKQFFGINRNRVWEIEMREKWLTKGFWWFKICEGEKSLLFRASLLQQWTVRYCGLWNYLLWGCELDQETENMLLPAKPKDLGF